MRAFDIKLSVASSVSIHITCHFLSPMNVTRLSSLSSAECVGAVQEPGPAAAPARLPNSDALQHASGQRFHHQPRSHGDHRIQAQAALKPVWIKRGNKKTQQKQNSTGFLGPSKTPMLGHRLATGGSPRLAKQNHKQYSSEMKAPL